MVICTKCMKKQSRRSESVCPYEGNKKADPIHAWMDYEGFINELCEKLFPFIRERIAELQKKLAKNQALFNERMAPLCKRVEELQADYDEYCKYELPRDVEKEKKRAVGSHLRDVIVAAVECVIVVFIAFKWIFPFFGLKLSDIFFMRIPIFGSDDKIAHFIPFPIIGIGMIVLVGIFLGKPLVEYFKEKRHAESRSQMIADELTRKWRDINGFDEAKSNIKAEKDKYNNIQDDFESRIYSAECALTGNNEDLLNFYDMDNKIKNYYLENIYDGAW